MTYDEEIAAARPAFEAEFGQVWTTTEMTAEFDVLGFLAPYVVVVRKADDVKGSLTFTHQPRFYYCWEPSNA